MTSEAAAEIQQTPITRNDVDTALFARAQIVKLLPDLTEPIRGATIVMWNWYSFLQAASTFKDRIRDTFYFELVDGEEKIAFKPPYLDRYHFFIESPPDPVFGTREELGAGEGTTIFFGLSFLFEKREDDLSGMKIVQALIENGVTASVRTFKDLYEACEGDASSLYIMFEIFMASRYTNIQQMRPRKDPSIVRSPARAGSDRAPEIIAVIARKPEKVHNAEQRKLAEQAAREGKSWILGHESHTHGHWRFQWYPSTKSHKRIFIPDFVRGAGKPTRKVERVIKVCR